jgi:hypothetical protein
MREGRDGTLVGEIEPGHGDVEIAGGSCDAGRVRRSGRNAAFK